MVRRTKGSRALGSALQPRPMPAGRKTRRASEAERANDADSLTLDGLSLGSSKAKRPDPFPFMSLPGELRLKVYAYHFADAGKVMDLDPDNHKRLHRKLALFKTCRTIYSEASHYYYSSRTFRLFPTFPGRFLKTKKPLLARLTPSKRACLTSLEMRLGPGWNAPPRGWVVNPALGLKDCINVRRLTVFVECDPSDSVFTGFRRSEGFYELFCQKLLGEVLAELPALEYVDFDGWSSVKKSGEMMKGLMEVAIMNDRGLRWGPERGWTDAEEKEEVRKPIWTVPSVSSVSFGIQQGVMVTA
ncbi:hypothetical protein HYQ45_002473 [Verticillium longisporum]|uniref:Uncharacterized protein n=4 Tax=Verticillium TaxID=1036719 RepID=G2X8T1_VERDV|nr:uncharacterized protein VDAG_06222 [Verticillium dahliae VdLs.17]KAF3342215.1 hypothetical protein VdG2_09175 [Verticillium dahliae VDG2]KAG7140756.1 hypothetical protein HYQ45_002473 [Verticillium longisporum]KAH6698021.1 hypothetical protein EV126DRAFT_64410 [Verticillium dahliae]EGY15368.1 hypothetical protein VDAG_06222 [Verticillium dahliae VdLs.17]PNH27168.1 hypothetical protein BJF96_g9511 [Verticillium dahliae]